MDTALAAIKRSARAVLKDELRVLRAQLRALRADNASLAEQRDTLRQDLARASHHRDTLANELGRITDRARRSHAWAKQHAVQNGNRAALCLTDWTLNGTGGAGFGVVHPFDRWGISPKP
jgi:aminoglycoside phosphotransferase (APT) family kinase protein